MAARKRDQGKITEGGGERGGKEESDQLSPSTLAIFFNLGPAYARKQGMGSCLLSTKTTPTHG